MNTELEALRSRNPGVEILPAADPQFASYGRLLTGFDLSEIEAWGRTVAMPESGNAYQASDAVLEALPAAQAIGLAVYGGMPFQAGPCRGHNHVLNGIEYHSGSEVAVCLQPCVLILGHLWDMQGNTYDGAKTQAFYCEAGQVVQTYETTLHYTPGLLPAPRHRRRAARRAHGHPEKAQQVVRGTPGEHGQSRRRRLPRPAGCHARDQISDPSFCKPEVHCDPQCASGFFYVRKNSLSQSLSALPASSRREPWGGAALFLVQKRPPHRGGWHRAAMTGGVLCAGSHPLPVEHIVAGGGIAGQG